MTHDATASVTPSQTVNTPRSTPQARQAPQASESSDSPTSSHSNSNPSPPTVDLSNPRALWQAVSERTARVGSLAWVSQMELVSVEGSTVTLRPKTGRSELRRFANADRCRELAKHFQELTGQPMQVVLEPDRALDANKALDSEASGGSAGSGGGQTNTLDRRAAFDVPLVKDVLEVFPEAMVLEVRPDEQAKNKQGNPQAYDAEAGDKDDMDGVMQDDLDHDSDERP